MRGPSLARRFVSSDVTWTDCLEATQAVVMMAAIRLGLRVTRFDRVRALLQRTVPARPGQTRSRQAESATVAQTARIVNLAARVAPASSTCLHRSLTLWWLLARRGISSNLRVGVRRDDPRFQAHAWVEFDGTAVNQRAGKDHAEARDYAPLAGFPMNDA